MLTVEELLKPRYKVIADYPDSPFSIGTIINLDRKNGFYIYEYYEADGKRTEYESTFKCYPHLFKPLAWYEERDKKDMPLYLKGNSGEVLQCEWFYDGKTIRCIANKHKLWFTDYLPATEEEYLNYINHKP